MGSRYRLSLADDLLKAIYNTLEIEEEKVQLSKHDQMYGGVSCEEIKCFSSS